jgi:L-threonylcarbamoyladenylate synthase
MTTFEFLTRTPAGLLRFADAARTAEHLRAGGLAVLPTETGYLLGALATDLAAVRAVFVAKGRDPANPVHVACSSIALAARFAVFDARALDLLGRFTPGPLTVVVPQRDTLPTHLVTMNGTVGIRVPDHPATLQVVDLLGSPITATSLNRSGEESKPLDRGQLETLAWPATGTVLVLEHDAAITEPRASTLVRVAGTGDLTLLRPGPIDLAALEA